MQMIKLALIFAGVAFGTSAYAQQDVNNGMLSDEAIVLLFNEGDQPVDLSEAEAFSEVDSPDAARMYLNCRSSNYRTTRCPVRGRIHTVRLMRRTSFAPCIAGRTFGATSSFVWVSRGCSGQFLVQYDRRGGRWGDDDGRGRGGRRP